MIAIKRVISNPAKKPCLPKGLFVRAEDVSMPFNGISPPVPIREGRSDLIDAEPYSVPKPGKRAAQRIFQQRRQQLMSRSSNYLDQGLTATNDGSLPRHPKHLLMR